MLVYTCMCLFYFSCSCMFICLIYNMFIIANVQGGKDESVVPTIVQQPPMMNKENFFLNFKNISTCSLAVACFSVSSFPKIIYCAWRFTSKSPFYDRQVMSFALWSCTFLAMNSTFNCLIFFWRNSILRREGMKVVKCFRFARS